MSLFVRLRLLLLLLFCVGLSTGTVIFWEEFAHNNVHSGVLHDTGYPHKLLRLIWSRPAVKNEVAYLCMLDEFSKFKNRKGGAEYVVALCFYAGLWYMHLYPSAIAFGQRVWRGFGRLSKDNFYDLVCFVIIRFSQVIKEHDYNWRLHPDNHGVGSIFERYVTCFVDTTPLFYSSPDDKALYDRLYAPLYGGELVVFVHNVSHFNL